MSFQTYDGFQGQATGEQAGAPVQQPDLGQPIDGNAGGFPQSNLGGPGGGGPEQQGGDAKTTLW